MRKRFVAIALFVAVLLSMIACGSSRTQVTSESVEKKDDSIRIWAWDDTFNAKAAQLAAEYYRKKHPQAPRIEVTTKEREEILSDVKLLLSSQVYEKTGVPMLTLDPTDLPLMRIIMQSCGRWYVAQDGVTADIQQNKALRQALDIYTELLERNLGMSVNGWNEFISAFQNGEVASVISGGWVLSSIKENQEQSGLWRVTRIPLVENNQDAVPASNVGGSAWYILKNSAHAAVAADFMTEMFAEDAEFMNTLVEQIGIMPSLKDLSVLESYRNTDDFFGGQSVTRLLNGFASVVPTVNYGSKTYEIEDILESEFQNELSNGNMDSCLKRVQMKAEAVARE